MRKLVFVALAMGLLIGLVSLVACGGPEATPEPTPEAEAYKIGAVLAITGFNSDLGEPEEQTLEMLENQLNAAGGINGHPVNVIIYDTETDNTTCLTAVTRLIEQDNVLAIIGPSSSGVSMAILDTVTDAEIPLVSLAAADQIVQPVEERYWVFKTPQTNSMVVNRVYEYLDGQGISQVAVISATDGFGVLGHGELIDFADDWGITIVADETFDPDDTDMTTQLTRIKGEAPEAVICWGTNKGSAVIANNMRMLEMEMPLVMSHGIANKDFIALAGEDANGIIFPAGKLLVAEQLPTTDPQRDVLLKYTADFEALHGEGTVDTFGGHAWDGFMLVTNAIRSLEDKGLEVNRAGIRDEIESAELVGISGVFHMSASDHLGLAPDCLVLVQIADGEWVLLED